MESAPSEALAPLITLLELRLIGEEEAQQAIRHHLESSPPGGRAWDWYWESGVDLSDRELVSEMQQLGLLPTLTPVDVVRIAARLCLQGEIGALDYAEHIWSAYGQLDPWPVEQVGDLLQALDFGPDFDGRGDRRGDRIAALCLAILESAGLEQR